MGVQEHTRTSEVGGVQEHTTEKWGRQSEATRLHKILRLLGLSFLSLCYTDRAQAPPPREIDRFLCGCNLIIDGRSTFRCRCAHRARFHVQNAVILDAALQNAVILSAALIIPTEDIIIIDDRICSRRHRVIESIRALRVQLLSE